MIHMCVSQTQTHVFPPPAPCLNFILDRRKINLMCVYMRQPTNPSVTHVAYSCVCVSTSGIVMMNLACSCSIFMHHPRMFVSLCLSLHHIIFFPVGVCVCVCVCARKRESKKEESECARSCSIFINLPLMFVSLCLCLPDIILFPLRVCLCVSVCARKRESQE